jgi:hypothetical protein
MDLAPDFGEFIASLNAHGVEFLIVGAYALAFHGAPRFTQFEPSGFRSTISIPATSLSHAGSSKWESNPYRFI